MEDKKSILQIIFMIGKIIIPIAIIIFIGFIGYKMYMEKNNTDKFYNCLKAHNIVADSKENVQGAINYSTFDNQDYLLDKSITKNEDTLSTDIILYYNKNKNSIRGELSMRGQNENNNFGIYLIYGTYDINSEKFKCDIEQDDGFPSKCNLLLTESKKFATEINNLLDSCDVNSKYILKESINKKIGVVK